MTVASSQPSLEGEGNINRQEVEPKTYSTLSQYYDFPNNEQEMWWTKSAPLLARVLESADYTVHQQYLFLSLYRTLMIPRMGPFPRIWHASITHSGIPVEFSLNYQPGGKRTVRVGFEPASRLSGGPRDRYNTTTVSEAIDQMSRLNLPGFDPHLYYQYLSTLTLSKVEADILRGAALPGSKFKTQIAFGLDFKGESAAVKCYVYPALKAHISKVPFRQLLTDAVKRSGDSMNCSCALEAVNEYMEAGGCYNQYSFIGFDCVTPCESRLKVYSALLDISWEKVAEIWTLGGRLKDDIINQKGLSLLRKLWELLTPEPERRPVGIWNYELSSKSLIPMPKFYIDMNGENDMHKAEGISTFFDYLGWKDTSETFLDTVKSYFPGVNLAETTRIIQYVSFSMTPKGEPYLSVYYHSSY